MTPAAARSRPRPPCCGASPRSTCRAPTQADLEQAIDAAADGDATAAAAVKRLLAADLPELGAGVFLDAAHHAAERNALSPASEAELARECFAAYVAPHLQRRARARQGARGLALADPRDSRAAAAARASTSFGFSL